jgi:hypothetical protein
MKRSPSTVAALACAAFAPTALGQTVPVGDEQSLLELRNTVVNILEALVQRGVLTQQEAQTMVARAQEQAATEIAELRAQGVVEEGAVRVTYVPETVKEEISAAVAADITDVVVEDVVERAQTEGWGVPAGLPSWARNIDVETRLRVRGEGRFFDEENAVNTYLNFNEINEAGGIGLAGQDALLNTTVDRSLLRARLRVDLTARVAPTVTARLGFSTGNFNDPISMNQTLANYGRRLNFAVQNASIDWALANDRATRGFDLYMGRFDNPFRSSSLVFDEDLSFEGVAGKFKFDVFGRDRARDGVQPGVFLLFGAFPLEEVELESDDKWLYAGQLGLEVPMGEMNTLRLAWSYYGYHNILGLRNSFDSQLTDYTVPALLARGNTLFDIRNDLDPDTNLFALASEYELNNVIAELDFGAFGANHVILRADYIENQGFDAEEVAARIGEPIEPRIRGRQVEVSVGRPRLTAGGQWRVFGAYRYLERDATLDAFVDSDFGLGGTDTEGYILGFDLGVTDNTWFTTKWLSSNEIDGPPLSIDVLQVDINARF